MASMIGRVSGLGLGIEFVYTRQQAVLDQRQRGTLNDEAFRRRIHYEEHWGFPWTGYRLLLERARTLGVPVFALDREPRGGASQLAVRDDHAARQIARILTEGRAGRLLVFFGESHVSPGRLPRKTLLQARGMGMDPSSVTVLQDPEGAYWNFLREGARAPAFADLGDGCFATFHTAPLHRYER
jgi:hypothetical protein